MKIEVFYIDGCPNYLPALNRLRTVLRDQGFVIGVEEIEVKDVSQAKALNFLGSPAIRVNGLDIDVDSRSVTETGIACRCYSGGLPSEEMIRVALLEALER